MLFEQEQAEYRQALNKAMEYLSLRDHSSGELYQKVRAKLENDQAAAAAVARCVELGMLDDQAFARRRAEYLLARSKSPAQIRSHLVEKGVDRCLAQQVVEELVDQQDISETVYQLLQKSYRRKLEQGKHQNVMAAMARRGFSMGVVRQALERWQQEQECCQEEFCWPEEW